LLNTAKSQFKIASYNASEELARFDQYRKFLVEEELVIDSPSFLSNALATGKSILAEGANATLLDIDFGTYPFVTSSSTTVGGLVTGLGIPPSKINTAIGVVKAYTTRVGEGPFPTELKDSVGEKLRKDGAEFGTTTGRPRRCGWLDLPVVNYSQCLNNFQSINITKLDVLSAQDELKIGVAYEIEGKKLPKGYMPATLTELAKVKVVYETMPGWKSDISKITEYEKLPQAARNYLDRIEDLLKIPISWVGVGPGRHSMLIKPPA